MFKMEVCWQWQLTFGFSRYVGFFVRVGNDDLQVLGHLPMDEFAGYGSMYGVKYSVAAHELKFDLNPYTTDDEEEFNTAFDVDAANWTYGSDKTFSGMFAQFGVKIDPSLLSPGSDIMTVGSLRSNVEQLMLLSYRQLVCCDL